MDAEAVPDAIPRAEPRSRYGNPDSYVVNGDRYHTLRTSRGFSERGVASWYGRKFHGRRTSNGERYDMYAMTAAHRRLPLPSYVRVTHLGNGRSVVVRVNDRGPFHSGRVIDLSYAAARKLRMIGTGTAPVQITAVEPGEAKAETRPGRVGSFSLQLAAFSERTNAERFAEEAAAAVSAKLGDPRTLVTTAPVSTASGVMYRVRLGPLADRTTALELARQLLQEAGEDELFLVVEGGGGQKETLFRIGPEVN